MLEKIQAAQFHAFITQAFPWIFHALYRITPETFWKSTLNHTIHVIIPYEWRVLLWNCTSQWELTCPVVHPNVAAGKDRCEICILRHLHYLSSRAVMVGSWLRYIPRLDSENEAALVTMESLHRYHDDSLQYLIHPTSKLKLLKWVNLRVELRLAWQATCRVEVRLIIQNLHIPYPPLFCFKSYIE